MTIKPNNKNRQTYLLTALAIVPVFCACYFYTHHVMDRSDDDEMAMFMTVYFIACIYAGRYLSPLINSDKNVSRRTFTITGSLIIVSAALFLILTQATVSLNLNYIRILFVGVPFTIFSLCLGIMIKLVRTNMQYQLQEAKATAEQNRSELRFLQNQLNPHFLFNTLNNIYGISLTQHERIPGLLLKLSDLLRYSVYDAKELFVPLKSEAAYIKDYIEFEKIRIGDKLVLEETYEEIDVPVNIAPMLLIVFVENAFKHSKNATGEKIYIKIIIKTWANTILFSVKNSCGNHTEKNMINKDSGFGLENVTKRLELLYKGEYDLTAEKKDGFYNVMLQLKSK